METAVGSAWLLRALCALWLALLLALPPALRAQDTPVDDETFANMVSRWNSILDFPENLLSDPEISPYDLEPLTENVELVNKLAIKARRRAEEEMKRQQRLLDAMGPPPGEDEPAEAQDVAEKRAAISARLADYDARVKQTKVISARALDILGRIGDLEISVMSQLLGKRSASPLNLGGMKEGVVQIPQSIGQFAESVKSWWRNSQLAKGPGSALTALAVLAVGLVLITFTRRWLLTRYGMVPDEPSPSLARRFLAILVEALARVVLPILVITVASIIVLSDVQLPRSLAASFKLLALASIQTVLIAGLARASLTSASPQWRILEFTDAAAAGLERAIRLYAVGLLVVNVAIVSISPTLGELGPLRMLDFDASTESAVLVTMIGLIVASLLALNVLREKRWRFRSRSEDDEPLEQPASFKVRLLFGVARTTIVAGVLLFLVGYLNLGVFLVGRTMLTLSLIALSLTIHGLVREGLRQATSLDNAVGQWVRRHLGLDDAAAGRWTFWVVLLLDTVLIAALALILLNAWGVPWTEIKPVFSRLFYGTEIGGYTFSLVNFGIALGAFIAVMVLIKLFQRFLSNRILVQTRLDVGARDAVTAGVGYAGVVVAVLISLSLFGLKFGEIALIFSALSIGIGFGLQHVVNNFISGLILLVQRPIKAGDWIVVGQNQGYVKRINVISTEITTFDNAAVIIPNSQLMTTDVINWTHRSRLGRVRVPVGVSYASDPQRVKEVLLQCANDNEAVLTRPPPQVMFMSFGESSLDFELRVFIKEVDYTLATASELRFAIKKALDEAGIEIPFPQRDIHMKGLPEGLGPTPA